MTAAKRMSLTKMVHGEIDELVKLNVLTPERAQKLKDRLTPSVIKQHVQDGMTTRDIIDTHNDLADPVGFDPLGPLLKQSVSPEEQFAENVLACVDDLNAVLPRLAARYEDLVIVAALAEHVGGALRILMEAGICSSTQARRVLRHIEDTAFSRASLEPEKHIDLSRTTVETPFRLTISLNPYLATPVVVERDLTQEEALTFLSSMWEGLEAEGDPPNESPEEYLARLRVDGHECVTVSNDKFGFELYRSASCKPATVRHRLLNAPSKSRDEDPQ